MRASIKHYNPYKQMLTRVVWKKNVEGFITSCSTCQQSKYVPRAPLGLLKSIPPPNTVWEDVQWTSSPNLIILQHHRLPSFSLAMNCKLHSSKSITSSNEQSDRSGKPMPSIVFTCFCAFQTKELGNYLHCIEWIYNTSTHRTTGLTPFEVVYGRQPP